MFWIVILVIGFFIIKKVISSSGEKVSSPASAEQNSNNLDEKTLRKFEALETENVLLQFPMNQEMISKRASMSTINHPNLENEDFQAELAAVIVKHATPYIDYLKKVNAEKSAGFYSFYPLAFVTYFMDQYKTGSNRQFAYAMEKKIEKLEDYSALLNNSNSLEDSGLFKMVWDDAIWKNYCEFKASEKKANEAIAHLFVRIGRSCALEGRDQTYVHDNRIDQTILYMFGPSLESFDKEMSVIWDKYSATSQLPTTIQKANK